MSITDNDPDNDSGILQMDLVVSEADAKGNGIFNEELNSDHEGSGPPPLIDPSYNESTPHEMPSLIYSWASMTQYLSLVTAAYQT